MVDLRGCEGCLPPGAQILSISCNFWKKIGKIVCWYPPLESWHPHLWEILDPPLQTTRSQKVNPPHSGQTNEFQGFPSLSWHHKRCTKSINFNNLKYDMYERGNKQSINESIKLCMNSIMK